MTTRTVPFGTLSPHYPLKPAVVEVEPVNREPEAIDYRFPEPFFAPPIKRLPA